MQLVLAAAEGDARARDVVIYVSVLLTYRAFFGLLSSVSQVEKKEVRSNQGENRGLFTVAGVVFAIFEALVGGE